MPNILIIDQDNNFSKTLYSAIRDMGHEAICVSSLVEGVDKARSGQFDVVFLDARMAEGSGINTIPEILNIPVAPEVIIITDSGDPQEAELAIKMGAWDYIDKHTSITSLTKLVDHVLQYRTKSLPHRPSLEEERKSFDDIVGNSPLMKACKDLLLKLANSDANVLISGETGTGKELLAWSIHNNSHRSAKNFVVVDCASLPDHLVENILLGHEKGSYTGADKAHIGLIKQADGGTLFLDEIGELPISAQKSFLRVLEERRFRPIGSSQEITSDFRLISSTNRNLDEMVRSNQFRQDLLFRIRSFGIELPPLRNRTEDIKDIIRYHMTKLCDYYEMETKQVSHEFLTALSKYFWPGNVRELINALERSIVAARQEPVLFSKHLPTYIRVSIARTPFDEQHTTHTTDTQNFQGNLDPSKTLPSLLKFRQTALAEAEMHYLRDLMSLTKGNIKEACRVSGLSRSRLYALLKKYRIFTSTN